MKRIRFVFTICVGLFISGCGTDSKYTKPEMPVPSEFSSYRDQDEAILPSSEEGLLSVADINWKAVFADEKLQNIIEIALNNNRDLRLAVLNVERSRALYNIQRAELLPTVNAAVAGSKQRVPADLSSTGKVATQEQYSVNLGITAWEIDLFGRLKSLKEQALQQYFSTRQVRRGAQTSLVGEVARIYLTLAADRENLQLAQSTLKAQEDVHEMINHQYKNGIATEVDFRRSQIQVDVARGDIARYTQLVAQDRNALNLVTGISVPDNLLPKDLSSVLSPRDIAVGLSSDVLLRRPDIMAAECQLKAAYASIDAARASFFPRISLTTILGTASREFSGLFDSGSDTWTFAPQASMPIFDARVSEAFNVSKVIKDMVLTQYEKTIQTAFREVSDVFVIREMVKEQVSAQESIVESAKKVYELSNQRYVQGIDGYLGVLDAQRSLYSAQQSLTYLHLAKLINQVKLFAVLGGDL